MKVSHRDTTIERKIIPQSERQFANLLTNQKRTWVYEPCRFHLRNPRTTYTPDFLSDGIYYEVVGSYSALRSAKPKLAAFLLSFPQIKFRIVNPDGSIIPHRVNKNTVTIDRKIVKPGNVTYLSVQLDVPTYTRIKQRAKKEVRTITGLLRLLSFAPTPPLKSSSDA